MKSKVLLLLSVFLIGTIGISCQTNKNNKTMNTTTVSNLDVNRFMGSWYEIARYEHSFEKGMTHVKANYSLLPDGTIRVLNSGMKNGKKKEIEGKQEKRKTAILTANWKFHSSCGFIPIISFLNLMTIISMQ